jgi:hypothetical protein
MIYEVKIKFPCGYEFYLYVKSIFIRYDNSQGDGYKICPIHGYECKSVK